MILALQSRQQQQQQQQQQPTTAGQTAGAVHVPYRNSKLTLLLSDALGAKGACAKTLMLMPSEGRYPGPIQWAHLPGSVLEGAVQRWL